MSTASPSNGLSRNFKKPSVSGLQMPRRNSFNAVINVLSAKFCRINCFNSNLCGIATSNNLDRNKNSPSSKVLGTGFNCRNSPTKMTCLDVNGLLLSFSSAISWCIAFTNWNNYAFAWHPSFGPDDSVGRFHPCDTMGNWGGSCHDHFSWHVCCL